MNEIIAWGWLAVTCALAATSLTLTWAGPKHAARARNIDHALAVWCLLGLVYLFAGGTP